MSETFVGTIEDSVYFELSENNVPIAVVGFRMTVLISHQINSLLLMLTVHSSAPLKKTFYSVQNPKYNSLLGTKHKSADKKGSRLMVGNNAVDSGKPERSALQQQPKLWWNRRVLENKKGRNRKLRYSWWCSGG